MDVSSVENMENGKGMINPDKNRYPHCIVWTPIPMITWLFPFIGHMGICTYTGIIRDFAGPYYVSEDNMGFGNPTKYWQLSLEKVPHVNAREAWDRGVYEASEEYKGRMVHYCILGFTLVKGLSTDNIISINHNLCCDNCHSHVGYALNLMKYGSSDGWNMVNMCFRMLIHGKYVSFGGFLKTWLPFLIIIGIIVTIVLCTHLI